MTILTFGQVPTFVGYFQLTHKEHSVGYLGINLGADAADERYAWTREAAHVAPEDRAWEPPLTKHSDHGLQPSQKKHRNGKTKGEMGASQAEARTLRPGLERARRYLWENRA